MICLTNVTLIKINIYKKNVRTDVFKKWLISQARITKLNERIYKINKTKKKKILKNKLHHMVHSYYSSKIPFRDSSLFMCTPGNGWSSGVLFGWLHTCIFHPEILMATNTHLTQKNWGHIKYSILVFIWKMMNHLFSCQEKNYFPRRWYTWILSTPLQWIKTRFNEFSTPNTKILRMHALKIYYGWKSRN